MNIKSTFFLILRITVAIILLQTLYFKFGGAEESIYIFTKTGMEPWGRIGSGIVELIASILLLWPATIAFGALLALGTMSGALFFHFTLLGIDVMGDGGLLFYMALFVWLASFILLFNYKTQVLDLLKNRKK